MTAIISVHGSTALHVAATYGQSEFVEKIAHLMPVDALAIQNLYGMTALHLIAGSGTVKAAKVLVEKKPSLTQIVNERQETPLEFLCSTMPLISSREREMLWYLCRVTKDEDPCLCFSGRTARMLMIPLFSSGHFDLCLYLLQRYPNLAKAAIIDDSYKSIVWLCAGAPEFPSGTKLSLLEYCIYKILPSTITNEQEPIQEDIEDQPPPRVQVDVDADVEHDGQVPFSMQPRIHSNRVLQWFVRVIWKVVIEQLIAIPSVKKVYDIKLRHQHSFALLHYICQLILRQKEKDISEFFLKNNLIYNATRRGVVEIIAVFLRYFPDLMEFYRNDDIALLHVAVKNRRENVFNLLMELSAPTASIVFEELKTGGNILHLAAKLAPSHQLNSVSGPALQMQRELQWFKEVEKLVPNMNKRLKQNGETPQEVFSEEHEELKGKGEKWMRETSNSAMVVTTLIATIAFAAAITVPGGNDDKKGTPIFLKNDSFMVFAISDALALFSSVTSLIMFLAILTARYAEEDFLESLPRKMIIGLSSLFVAIAAMMISFGAALSILLGETLESIFLPLTLLSCVPVALFGMLQLPLLIQMFQSTYGRSIFYRPGDHNYRDIAYKKVN